MTSGKSIIGFKRAQRGGTVFRAFNPESGLPCNPSFESALAEDVEVALDLAARAFSPFRTVPGAKRAELLRAVASALESGAEPLIDRAHLETALSKARLQAELGRTTNQLRLFANVAEEGSWVMARIDRADKERLPKPKPDVRSMWRARGPVAVFGASNFPFAFSVAGGDTASALAAGNPVIVKAHPAHPGTSEMTGHAVQESIRSCGLPEGVFSLLFDSGTSVSASLVQHPLLRAVAFTGSCRAGRTLIDLAASRALPIPVFAEMASTNPVFVLPRALEERTKQIASGLFESFTLGGGQFCTKPGLIFVPEGPAGLDFQRIIEDLVSRSTSFCLLTAGIWDAFSRAKKERQGRPDLQIVNGERVQTVDSSFRVEAMLVESDATNFLGNAELSEEVFGPTTVLVHHSSRAQLLDVVSNLKGHLTATVHGTQEDFHEFADVIGVLETKVGRLVFNGYPTGVEVGHAMIHGGPYPATSDDRSTSVGSQAILRFARPICFQDAPDAVLPPELQNSNPLGIWRMLDGQMTREGFL